MQIQPLGEVQQYGFDEEFYTLNFSMERERVEMKIYAHFCATTTNPGQQQNIWHQHNDGNKRYMATTNIWQQQILKSSKLYGINTSMATQNLWQQQIYGNNES